MPTLPSLGDGDKIWCPFYILDLMRHMTSRYIPRSHQGIIPVLMKVGIVEPVVPQLQPEFIIRHINDEIQLCVGTNFLM